MADETVVFNGRVYAWNGRYFRKSRSFLHRDVWIHFNGPIPKGYHVHHIDHDTRNNAIENLQMVWGTTHLSTHQRAMSKPKPVWAYPALQAWRESEAGKAALSEMGRRNSVYLGQEKEFKCECCGEYFNAPNVGHNRFCSNNCKSKWRRAAGLDDVAKVCVECGVEFKTNRFKPTVTCSLSCGRKQWLKTDAGRAHLEKLASAKRTKPHP